MDIDDEMGLGAGLNADNKRNPNSKSANDRDPLAVPASKPNLNRGPATTDGDLGKSGLKNSPPTDSLAGHKNHPPKDIPREAHIGASGLSNHSDNPKQKLPAVKDDLEDLLYSDSKPQPPPKTGNTAPINSKPNFMTRKPPADAPISKPVDNHSTAKPPVVNKPPAFEDKLFPDDEEFGGEF